MPLSPEVNKIRTLKKLVQTTIKLTSKHEDKSKCRTKVESISTDFTNFWFFLIQRKLSQI